MRLDRNRTNAWYSTAPSLIHAEALQRVCFKHWLHALYRYHISQPGPKRGVLNIPKFHAPTSLRSPGLNSVLPCIFPWYLHLVQILGQCVSLVHDRILRVLHFTIRSWLLPLVIEKDSKHDHAENNIASEAVYRLFAPYISILAC